MTFSPVILYVEDDPMSRRVMELLLIGVMKFQQVTFFEDSEAFMERLAALPQQPDLIFLDIHMPPHDGFAVLEMLRTDERYQKTIVVALTASVMNEEVERLKQAGFDGVLAKPIDQTVFPELIQLILKGERIWNII